MTSAAQYHISVMVPRGYALDRRLIDRATDTWLRTGRAPAPFRFQEVRWGPDGLRLKGLGCLGVLKVYGSPRLSLADFDRPSSPSLRPLWSLAHEIGLRPEWTRLDRTRRGWHLLVRWNRSLVPAEHVAVQLLLGSDPHRETFNLMRVVSMRIHRRPSRRWNVLFERKVTRGNPL
jgi:hypothetical protein